MRDVDYVVYKDLCPEAKSNCVHLLKGFGAYSDLPKFDKKYDDYLAL